MTGIPISKTKTRRSPPQKATERRATAKTKATRQKALLAACRRSGLEGFEILQILADWYGWQKLVITSAPGITEHTVFNAWSQSKAEKKYRTSQGST
jgi:hypothetical protein